MEGSGEGEGGGSQNKAEVIAAISEQLEEMWKEQIEDIKKVRIGSRKDFKRHNDLPIARIKRIMKSDEDVRMISAETPVMFAKACEMFILELTLRSRCYLETQGERTALGKECIQLAIQNTPTFDFLVDM